MSEYKIKRLPPQLLLSIPGEWSDRVEQIGRGRFTIAYRSIKNCGDVYLSVDSEAGDYSKEILSALAGESPYFPTIEKIGSLGDRDLYQTRYYRRLKASDKAAWAEYHIIAKAREDAWQEAITERNKKAWDSSAQRWHQDRASMYGYKMMARTIDLVREREPHRAELADALQDLANAAANYGSSYVFEFAPRNLGVDSHGHLILLDPVFDLETNERQHQERIKRARSHYR